MIQQDIQGFMPPEQMIEMFTFKEISNRSINAIASTVSGLCEKHKFALLQTYNYHEIVAGKGFPISRKVFIYEVCQAKTASLMLTTNPEFSIFMPCKIALYEMDGKTIISTMNMEIVLKAVEQNSELYAEAISLFNTLKTLIHSLATSN